MSYRFADSLQLDALIFQIYFWNKTLHVSDSSFVHHQEFFTVHTTMVYTIAVFPKINLRNECIWLVLLQEHLL